MSATDAGSGVRGRAGGAHLERLRRCPQGQVDRSGGPFRRRQVQHRRGSPRTAAGPVLQRLGHHPRPPRGRSGRPRLPLRRQRGLRRADRARRPAGVGRDPRRPAAFRHTARARRARVGRRAARAGRGRPARRPRAQDGDAGVGERVRRAPVARRARATAAQARHRVTRAVRPAPADRPRGVGGPRRVRRGARQRGRPGHRGAVGRVGGRTVSFSGHPLSGVHE